MMVLRAVRRFFRRILIGRYPPTLRSVLYRVILLAVLIPVVLSIWSMSRNSQASNQDLRSLEQALDYHEGAVRPDTLATPADFKKLKDVVLGTTGLFGDFNILEAFDTPWPTSPEEWSRYQQSDASDLPPSAFVDLQTKGYAFGDCLLDGRKARFALWHSPSNDLEVDLIHLRIVHFLPSSATIGVWLLFLFGAVLYLSIIAAPAAAILERYIAKPILRLARASQAIAHGGHPVPVPARGPAEVILLSSSFNYMAAELEKAQAAERVFLMSVSHEFKTPLTAIEGYAELLEDGAVSPGEAGPVLAAEAGRLRRLVNDLLDLAKINQSSFSIGREPVSLAVVSDEVLKRHAPQAKDLGVSLCSRAVEPAYVLGDKDRVVQVVSNLVENALRCTPPGRAVSVETIGTQIMVGDEGPGLSSEDLSRAFERFYLYDRMRGQNDVGNGLGLAIVKELVDRMGGTISAESVLGKGTTFTVALRPVGSPDAAPAAAPASSRSIETMAPEYLPDDYDGPAPTRRRRWTYYSIGGFIWALGAATITWPLFGFFAVCACTIIGRTNNRTLFWAFLGLSVVAIAIMAALRPLFGG